MFCKFSQAVSLYSYICSKQIFPLICKAVNMKFNFFQSLESGISSASAGEIENKVQFTTALTGRTQPTLATVANHSNMLTTQQLVATASGGTSGAPHTLAVSTPSGLAQVASLGAHSSTGHPTTVAVVASGAGGTGTKTIVVVPVSATSGSGDAPTIKRIKTN